jgi:hypothetical protein
MVRRVLQVAAAGAVLGSLLLSALFPLPGQEDARPWAVGLMAFPVAAALVLINRPGNPIGRLLGVVGAAAGIIFIGGWASVAYPGDWSRYLEAIEAGAVVVQFWAIISLLYVFPTGAPDGRGPRVIFRIFTAWMMAMAVIAGVRPGPLDLTARDNPLGLGPVVLHSVFDIGLVSLPIGVVLGVGVLVRRRRHAGVVERAQLKWFTSSSALLVAVVVVIAFVPEGRWETLLFPIVVGGFWALPTAIVVAVLRYRLFDIDRLVSRSVTYGATLVTLAAVYVAVVFVISSALPRQGSLAVAASTLAVAALFRPLAQRVQQAVDRRFNRPRYDLEREVAAFVGTLRDQVGLEELRAGLLEVVSGTMQPRSVAMWVRPTDRTPTKV